ncbi:hypothetical protein EVA_13139 [gut metagenome]|uniref:Uncharacterized protein n=1 Tax=gut metagenome TaxID=749906 RepID=J9GH69_9ZZZZ
MAAVSAIIVTPTIIKRGAVTCSVITLNSGDKNKDIKNSKPVTTFARPVLAPASIPVIVSAKVVAGLVPNRLAPKTEMLSAM